MLFAALAAAAALGASAPAPVLKLAPCDVEGLFAHCGVYRVPASWADPGGPTIGLNVVLVPARHKARPDAFAYIAGGPGVSATAETRDVVTTFAPVNEDHAILLVDQRGTGGSNPLECPKPQKLRACLARFGAAATEYGTRPAMDDLDAVRAALGYAQLDIYGTSYGATAAQVYLERHRRSVRTLTLDGATFLDVPFYSRFARNAQRALTQVATRCAADVACARAFPHWTATLARLVRSWNAHPVHRTRTATMSGDELAGVVQAMLLDANSAAEIPLVVTRAASGDFGPLDQQTDPGVFTSQLMFWSIWCNEPWVGLGARGPWHTLFDGYTALTLAAYRHTCSLLPSRAQPAAAWTRPTRTDVPLLVLAGGADPQDPVGNLPGLRRTFPNARTIVVPGYGHSVGQYGCLGGIVANFIDGGGAAGLDTRCVKAITPPPFVLH